MGLFKQYSESYEGGRCAYGYEFVESYSDRNGVYHKSYCRRIKKTWGDPEERESRLRQKSEQESRKQAMKIIAESDADNSNNPSPAGNFSERGL